MGAPGARIGDPMMHGPPLLGAPCPTVLIGKKPAWRVGDQHTCPIPNAPPPVGPGTPHGPGITAPPGALNVLVGGKPAARMGDKVMEPGAVVPPLVVNTIMMGCPQVLIGTGAAGGGGGGGGGGAGDASAEEGKCTKEGHPANVATGEVTAYSCDLEFWGLIPIRFIRTYSSSHANEKSDLGYGWAHSLGYKILLFEKYIIYNDASGRSIYLEVPNQGDSFSNDAEGVKIFRDLNYLKIQTSTSRELIFPIPKKQKQPVYPLQLRDSFGNKIDFKYKDGHLASLRDSAGRSILLQRDHAGRLMSLKLAEQDPHKSLRIREFHYDSMGDLVRVIDGVGKSIHYEYKNHLLIRETDRDGNSWFFSYDERKRCLETWGPKGLLYRRFIYGRDEEKRTRMIDSLGYQWIYEYNENGLVTSMISPLGYREEFLWSEMNEMLSRTDRNGHATVFEYDSISHNVSKIIDAEGNTWIFEYNERGQETKFIDPNGNVTEKTYTEKGALLEYRDPMGQIIRYEHDKRGLPSSIILPDGRRMDFVYDNFGFLRECSTDDELYKETYIHDFRGRILEIHYADGNHVVRTYDNENRMTRERDKKGIVFIVDLDGEGNVLRYTDEQDSEWKYEVDALGQVIKEIPPSNLPGNRPPVKQYVYNNESHITQIILPNGETYEYEYNGDRRLIEATYPDGRWVKLTCDGKGDILRRENSDGSFVESQYDAMGREISRELCNNDGTCQHYEFEYDAYGQNTLAKSDEHIVETEYNELGLQVREVQNDNEFIYEYDSLGRRVLMIYPDKKKVFYRYDDVKRTMVIESEIHGFLTYQFDKLFRPQKVLFPNGIEESYQFDEHSKMIFQEARMKGKPLFGRSYIRNKKGFVSKVVESDGRVKNIDYNGIERVLNVKGKGDTGREWNYSFDDLDNLTLSPEGTRWRYSAGSQLTASPDRFFRYNDRGETAEVESKKGITRYFYNAEGLLMRVEKPDNTEISFTYDALSRRVTKTVNGHLTRYFWDFIVPVVEVSNKTSTYTLFGPEKLFPLLRCESSQEDSKDGEKNVFALHIDAVGAVRQATDSRGKVVWSAEYTPLGKANIDPTSVFSHPFRVVGEYWDEELELGYHRLRYYDPTLGRFLTPDPKDIESGLNLYTFDRNAFEFFDPFGDNGWNPAWSVYGNAYENFVTNQYSSGMGQTTVPTSMGARRYDNFIPRTNTYHEYKYIGQNGVSNRTLSRMRRQLSKDEEFLHNNQNAKVRWYFNREPPPDVKKDLEAMKKKFGDRFDWEVKPPPACFNKSYVEPEKKKVFGK